MRNRHLLFGFLTVIFGLSTLAFASANAMTIKNTKTNNAPKADKYISILRNNQKTGKLELKDVLKAREQIRLMNKGSKYSDAISWEELGPDNFSGRTRAILFDNQDPENKTIFAAGVSGGIWKSVTVGQSWTKINIDGQCLNISCITQTPNGDIYVGTGEGFYYDAVSAYGGFIGQGIYKSTDGENFSLLENTQPVFGTDTVAWSYINKLAADNNGRVYASTNKGLWYSDDQGVSWNLAKSSDGTELIANSFDVDVASDGSVVACVDNKCFISDGDAENFICHSTDSTYDLPVSGIGRIEFAIAPSDPNYIYAVAVKDANDPGQLENIYCSTDKGVHWTIIGPGSSEDFNIFQNPMNEDVFLGLYDNVISVFPNNPERIIVGGIQMWEGTKVDAGFYNWCQKSINITGISIPMYLPPSHFTYVFKPSDPNTILIGCSAGVFMSNDGAETFHTLNRGYNVNQFYTVNCSKDGSVIGGSQDNGVLYIDGQGNTPMSARKLFTGQNGAYNAISFINPEAFILSNSDGNINRSDDMGENFSLNFNAPETELFLNPFILWESFEDENSRDSVTFTADKHYPANTSIIVKSNNNNFPFNYVLPIEMSEGDTIRVKDPVQSRLFLGIEDALYMTKEALDFTNEPEWFTIADKDNSGFEGTTQCIACSDNANNLYVGTQEGKLYRISNLALAYNFERADVSSSTCIVSTSLVKEFTDRAITSVAFDPQDDNHLVVTLGNYGNEDYVYMTNNALDSIPDFVCIQGNLPFMPVYSSLIEMENPDLIIIGTEDGIYTTDAIDGNSTVWVKDGANMGDVPVFMLKQQTLNKATMKVLNPDGVTYTYYPGVKNYGYIYAATYGRGLFQSKDFVGINDNDNPANINKSELNIYPNPVRDIANISFTLNKPSNVYVNIFDLNGRIIKSLDLYKHNKGTSNVKISCKDLTKGTYIMQVVAGQESVTSKFIVF
ncbi:MAG: T9SS type A sorting domain-containing protein [Bacteroidales bacterium]|nr:T9SS type A sorting domain-containing protein [Bacteroidales bacterium]